MKKNESPGENYALGLTRLYIFALLLVAILTIIGQILIQQALQEGEKDAYLVNVAGRQRMLSQKISKDVALLENRFCDDTAACIRELDSAIYTWKQYHYGLYHRKKELGLAGENSTEVMNMFQDLNPVFMDISTNVDSILQSAAMRTSMDRPARRIMRKEKYFLRLMNRIVDQYETEANAKVQSLQKTEFTLLVFTLLILFLEGMFIFRPAVQKIKQGFFALKNSEAKTRKSNQLLEAAQQDLQKVNAELEQKIQERTKEILSKKEELEVKNMEFLKVNRDLENFVYAASHDLKAPINNIEGLLEALDTEMETGSSGTERIISMMKQSVSKFRSVLGELSDIGKVKVEASGNVSRVPFKEVLDEIKISSKDLIDSSGAVLDERFSEAPTVRLSQKNLRSILYNLISNAIKYKAPERKPVVKIISRAENNYVILSVQDNGMGIKKEDIPSIFSMYTRLAKNVEGTGLGLSIIKNIMDNNGGKIEVVSEPGKGTTFILYFRN